MKLMDGNIVNYVFTIFLLCSKLSFTLSRNVALCNSMKIWQFVKRSRRCKLPQEC